MEKRFNLWKDKQKEKWCVRTPADLSESGKVERRSFPTKMEAQGFRDVQIARISNDGTGGATLSRSRREIAERAFAKLEAKLPDYDDSTLLQAVDEYLNSRNRSARSKTFIEAFQLWQAATVGKTRNGKPTSDKYRRQISYALPRLQPLHSKLLCEITADDVDATLEQAVAPQHAAARNGLVRVLRACLKWCLQYEWLDKVPVQSQRHTADTGQRQPNVLKPAQVISLLTACAEIDPDLLGYYVIALFAGVRPSDELAELQWENVFAGEGDAIHIPDNVSKTGRERYVPIEPTLREWLNYINPPQLGPVVPRQPTRKSPENQKLEWRINWISKRRKAVQRAAGINPWPQDAMRHTYASYWMTLHGDEDRCRDAMGHASKEVLVKHYRKHTTKADARAFWSITPETVFKSEAHSFTAL
jgi:integrase